MLNKFHFSLAILFFSLIANITFANSKLWPFSGSEIIEAKAAINYALKEKWPQAIKEAKRVKDPTVLKIVLWFKYKQQHSGASFEEITKFISENPTWPELGTLKIRAEEALNSSTPTNNIITWFNSNPPVTAKAMLYYAVAKSASGTLDEKTNQEITNLIRQAWIKGSYNRDEELDFIKKYSKYLREIDYVKRIDNLLWLERTSQARRILGRVSAKYQKLFNARMELSQNLGPVRAIIKNVPADLQQDSGLLYEAVASHDRKGNEDSVVELLKLTTNLKLSNPEKWWKIKIKYVRELIQDKKYKIAYNIAKSHNSEDPSDYADGEWLAGWISLSFLNNPQAAYKHFYNLYNNAQYSISKARGAYWAGKSAEKNNNADIATDWYRHAAKYPDTFYGQLALLKLNSKSHLILPKPLAPTQQELVGYRKSSLLKATYLFAKAGENGYAKQFLKKAIHSTNDIKELAFISEACLELGKLTAAVVASKEAARKGVIVTKTGYPILKDLPNFSIEKALALGIIRQESVFEIEALSSAGAQGLMQIMPATAKQLSKELKINYNKNKLFDPHYNIKLGTYYLGKLIKYYNGSYILAIAAYNAGQANVQRWINMNGDPRLLKNIDDIINWIEQIPFHETRNYVQRVLENIQNYRAVMSQYDLKLIEDLKR
jgi:soluble lytic murein transglycosylase